MKLRITSEGKELGVFENECELVAKDMMRKAAIKSLMKASKPIKVVYEKWNNLIKDWVEFGVMEGKL